MGRAWIIGLLAALIAVAPGFVVFGQDAKTQDDAPYQTLEQLGGALFADVNLSKNRSQACVSCHSPQLAFTDPHETPKVGGAGFERISTATLRATCHAMPLSPRLAVERTE